VRELEQCVRNILVRGHYRPRRPRAAATARADFLQGVRAGTLTADDLLRRYCTLAYAETGSYLATARRLRLDRRTTQGKVDPAWLAELHADGGAGKAPAARRRPR